MQPRPKAKNILLVEDDPVIRENFADMLLAEHFTVRTATTTAEALVAIEQRLPDIAMLDITLPDDPEGGFTLCANLRSRSQSLPIVFLTSHGGEIDHISALRLGADDYLTKDVSLGFVLARVHALFRRIDALARAVKLEQVTPGLAFDEERFVAYWNGDVVDLTLTQYWLLRALASQPGKVWRPEQLMREAHLTVEPNTIVAHITQIRRKLLAIDERFASIRTERGVGYRWMT